MSDDDVGERARQWLLDNGYSEYKDGEWNWNGHEVNAWAVLADYMNKQEREGK